MAKIVIEVSDGVTNGDIIQNICSMWIEYHDTDIEVTINKEVWNRPYKKIEALEQKEKTGHWVNAKVGKLFPSNDYKCSECGNILDFDGVNCGRGNANYCPNCGARMVKE